MFSNLIGLFIRSFIESSICPNDCSGAEFGQPAIVPSALIVKIFSSQSLQNVPPEVKPVSNLL
jgi:hypothetical protein